MSRPLFATLLVALFAATCADAAFARHSSGSRSSSPSHPGQAATAPTPGAYDYYVMALSWSPTFCRTHPEEDEQCAHKGYGFVMHGLWPQYQNGGGPDRCANDNRPDRHTIAETLAFMPSKRLINHEWYKHGACTGLDPDVYFKTADRAFATIHVPDELKAPKDDLQMRADDLRGALKRANPGLADDMMSLHCSQGDLVEVRVCVDKNNLGLRSCGKRMRSGCPASAPFNVPATR
jgi:ribonuclease T2